MSLGWVFCAADLLFRGEICSHDYPSFSLIDYVQFALRMLSIFVFYYHSVISSATHLKERILSKIRRSLE